MSEIEVRIVTLPPMRVASMSAYCQEPEIEVFNKLYAWAKAHNLVNKPCRIFGFDNPIQSPGTPNRGYEVWVTVDELVQTDGEVSVIDFPGGLYAVTRVYVQDPWKDIPSTWEKLVKWMEKSEYTHGSHQCLEEHIGPLNETVNDLPFTLDLYLPIRE